eukprot:1546778-Amphidinium_carterae.1
MYSGQRRILIQGAVSDAVQVTCGLPPGHGLAVDPPFCMPSLSALFGVGQQVEVRKTKALTEVNMQVNPPRQWSFATGHEPSRSSGRSGVPAVSHVQESLPDSNTIYEPDGGGCVRLRFGLPAHVKARIAKSLHSVGLYCASQGSALERCAQAWALSWPDS